jgi:hypothetical protein
MDMYHSTMQLQWYARSSVNASPQSQRLGCHSLSNHVDHMEHNSILDEALRHILRTVH